MKKRALIATSVLTLAILVAAPFAFAQRRMRSHAEDFGSDLFHGRLEKAKRALGLSNAQAAQIETIVKDLRTQNAPYRQSMHSGRMAIAQTLLSNPNDVAAAQALVDQQSAAERSMKTNVLNAASRALNVLTPDQRARLATFVQTRLASHAAR